MARVEGSLSVRKLRTEECFFRLLGDDDAAGPDGLERKLEATEAGLGLLMDESKSETCWTGETGETGESCEASVWRGLLASQSRLVFRAGAGDRRRRELTGETWPRAGAMAQRDDSRDRAAATASRREAEQKAECRRAGL